MKRVGPFRSKTFQTTSLSQRNNNPLVQFCEGFIISAQGDYHSSMLLLLDSVDELITECPESVYLCAKVS